MEGEQNQSYIQVWKCHSETHHFEQLLRANVMQTKVEDKIKTSLSCYPKIVTVAFPPELYSAFFFIHYICVSIYKYSYLINPCVALLYSLLCNLLVQQVIFFLFR